MATTLDRFAAVGLIDDASLAQQWVYSRSRVGKGKRRLAQELYQKGIDETQVYEALSHISVEEEYTRAREFLCKKIRNLDTEVLLDGHQRDRLLRKFVAMLIRRGYHPALALEVVKTELRMSDCDHYG